MLIGEVAKATGLTKDTIRYYTKLGLINASEKTAGSRTYVDYDEQTIEFLSEIKLAQSAGFTLNEIRDALSEFNQGKLTNKRMVELFEQKLAEVREKQSELRKVETLLLDKIKTYS